VSRGARLGVAALAAVTVLGPAACREQPAPPPPTPAARAEGAPLRPLTSRDGAAPALPGGTASLPPGHPPVSAGGPQDGGAIEGEIRLDARVRGKVQPGDVLFVIARHAATRQVAAVRKEEDVRFPFAFRLSSADAMMEGVPFDGPFDITARLSRSGDAIPTAGDLEGTAKGVAAGTRGVTVIIDTIRP
jgi:cytochrome c-type biogenesis protein CcmH